jgi:hypothetical protein
VFLDQTTGATEGVKRIFCARKELASITLRLQTSKNRGSLGEE